MVLPVLAKTQEIEIDEAYFSALRRAKSVLSNALAIEKKYEILLSNYHEFEQQILHVTASHMIRGIPRSPQDFRLMMDLDFKLMVDLRLVNLLTSARLYLDQLSGHVRDCLPHQADTELAVKSVFAAEYDSELDYRFMEALRNHVQHRGLAVHEVSISEGFTSVEGERLIRHSLEFRTLKSELAMDGNFKKTVLDEISDRVDLKLATRCYVESLSKAHEKIRNLIEESVVQSRQTIEDAISQYKKEYTGNVPGIQVWQMDGEVVAERDWLLLDGDDIRRKLQERNRKLFKLQIRYATNR